MVKLPLRIGMGQTFNEQMQEKQQSLRTVAGRQANLPEEPPTLSRGQERKKGYEWRLGNKPTPKWGRWWNLELIS
jgi:hypothetical protein